MTDKISDLAGINIYNKPVAVKHAELERIDPSMFRSVCPVCNEGCLLVKRHSQTFKIQADDHCILCGQQYIYEDIDDLRKRAGE